MANKYVDRNNALQRSNLAHTRLKHIMFSRKDIPSSDYHHDVLIKQYKYNRILTRKERKYIYEKVLKRHGLM